MQICDRCFKQSNMTANLPGRGPVAVCDRCNEDLMKLLDAYMTTKDFSVTGVVPGKPADPSDPIASNVVVVP